MSIPILRGARLLFRVDPLPRESPRGYLCRVAQEHGYCGPLSLAQIAGLPTSGLERDDSVKQIAHVLRLEPEEWQAMYYRHIRGNNRFDERSFYGQRISDDDLNYDRPRICPGCLKESPIWWAVWDLGLVTTCPIHRCHLVNQCPACKRRLAWQRESLNQWIAARDAELAPYMPRPEAERALGLKNFTLATVAAAGAMRYVIGPERSFPARCFFFLREDVMKIKDAFEKHYAPVKAYSKPGELIALRHAMKNYLGRDSGLAAVIRAVVHGSLVPVGYTNRFRGITGYLFRSEDLRKYRPVPGVIVPPEGVVTFGEAAAVLGVAMPVVRGLVAQGILHTAAEYRNGLSKLLPAADVQRFAEGYVATSVLARRFHLHGGSFARHLKESGIPLLAIPIPDVGKYYAFFVHKDVAAQIQVPSRRMLREAAERRIVAARKKKWVEYRQVKETALGRPMRRVRANCRQSGNGSK